MNKCPKCGYPLFFGAKECSLCGTSQKTQKNEDHNNSPVHTLKGTNGQLYVYENKIEITRKGVIALANQGLKGTKTIPISEIKSIQVKKVGLMQGYIQFGVSGGIESRRGVQAANCDENTVTFNSTFANKIAAEIKEYIESKLISDIVPNTVISPQVSEADEIMKYKKLLDDGVITQEEFDAKKKQLLGL